MTPRNIAINPNTCKNMPGGALGINIEEIFGNCSPAPAIKLTFAVQNMNAFIDARSSAAISFKLATFVQDPAR